MNGSSLAYGFGCDDEALDGLRIEDPEDDRGAEPDDDDPTEGPDEPGERAADEEGRSQRRDDGQDIEGHEPGVEVRVADTGRDAGVRVHELQLVELVAGRDGEQVQPAEDAEMEPDRRREGQAAPERPGQVATAGDRAGRPGRCR